MAIKCQKLMADFETTTEPDDLRVWASCAVDIDSLEVVHLSTDIESFFEFLKGSNSKVWFHNLKFDGEFILAYLERAGFKYVTGVHDSGAKKGKRKPLNTGEYTALITDDGLFYSIEVMFDRIDKTHYKKVTFYDSLKKLPFKVAKIAKDFEFEQSKGSIDYAAHRPKGYQLTPEEREYIITDCKIVAQALKIQFSEGLKKMTNAGDAMGHYKETLGKGNFEKRFPVLPIELDASIRRAYKGGFVYLNPKFKEVRGLKGKQYDVNSLYPWTMYECLLPYGYPVFFEGEPKENPNYPLYIVRIKCCFEIREGYIPMLQLKNNGRYVNTEYLTTSKFKQGDYWCNEPVEIVLTSVDLKLFLEHYKTEQLEYLDGYMFKGLKGMFKQYIDYWMRIKETTTGAQRQLAKLQLNSLYGRFALSTKARKKKPYLDEDEVIHYDYGEYEEREPVYTAMACFITAYAREKTIRSAQANYDVFIYADTDSLKLCTDTTPEGLEVHPTHLGAWKDEGDFIDSKWIRAKTYMATTRERSKNDRLKTFGQLLNDPHVSCVVRWGHVIRYNKIKVTCAGMPDNIKQEVTYENFAPESVFDGKLVPRRYPGGIILEPTTFTIK